MAKVQDGGHSFFQSRQCLCSALPSIGPASCTVRAVTEIMSSRSGSILSSIGKSMLWVWALMIPLFAFMPEAGIGLAGWSLTGFAVLGGFLFGMGAAMNGGYAYSTMARFVDGDGKMLATIIGFAVEQRACRRVYQERYTHGALRDLLQ
jgi:Sulphur transport